jgi:hypothetical protein
MTLTNTMTIPKLEDITSPTGDPRLRIADELAEDIVARPLTLPDFANDVKPFLVNPNLWPRWIFTDKRRYAQAKAQGWRNCVRADLKPGYANLSPYSEEGGTKYINGDLILMLIDRKIYLGALRYKHQVAAALSDVAVQRTVSAKQAAADLGDAAATLNQRRMAAGHDPLITTFVPGAADLKETVLGEPGVASKELGRIGQAGRDMGSMADLQKDLATGLDASRGPAKSTSF